LLLNQKLIVYFYSPQNFSNFALIFWKQEKFKKFRYLLNSKIIANLDAQNIFKPFCTTEKNPPANQKLEKYGELRELN